MQLADYRRQGKTGQRFYASTESIRRTQEVWYGP